MLTFTSPNGRFLCSGRAWTMLVSLARRYGWRPEHEPTLRFVNEHGFEEDLPLDHFNVGSVGADLPPGASVSMHDEDAANLAGALTKALEDVPRFDGLEEKSTFRLDLPGALPVRVLAPGVQVNEFEYFSGPNRPALERFVALCRGGGIRVS